MTTVQDKMMQGTARRDYIAPQLVQYGSVSDLTASGSANHGENNPGVGSNRYNHP